MARRVPLAKISRSIVNLEQVHHVVGPKVTSDGKWKVELVWLGGSNYVFQGDTEDEAMAIVDQIAAAAHVEVIDESW